MQFLRTFGGVFYAKSVGFWGSAPDPGGGAYSAPPHPLAGREGCPPPAPSPGRPRLLLRPTPCHTLAGAPPPSQFLDPPLCFFCFEVLNNAGIIPVFVQEAHVSWLWLPRTLLRECTYVIISIFRVINLLSTKYMAANTCVNKYTRMQARGVSITESYT